MQYSEFLELFEMLFREITSLNICNFNKECVKSKLQDSAYSSFKQVCKISDKNPSQRGLNYLVKALNYLVKSKHLVIQKAAKGNNTVIMSKINNILQETSKFKKS